MWPFPKRKCVGSGQYVTVKQMLNLTPPICPHCGEKVRIINMDHRDELLDVFADHKVA